MHKFLCVPAFDNTSAAKEVSRGGDPRGCHILLVSLFLCVLRVIVESCVGSQCWGSGHPTKSALSVVCVFVQVSILARDSVEIDSSGTVSIGRDASSGAVHIGFSGKTSIVEGMVWGFPVLAPRFGHGWVVRWKYISCDLFYFLKANRECVCGFMFGSLCLCFCAFVFAFDSLSLCVCVCVYVYKCKCKCKCKVQCK